MSNYIEELLKSSVSDQVFAECVGIANKVSKGTSCVCPRLLFLVLQEVDKKFDARA